LGASITWARELIGVNNKLRTPTVIDAVVRKVAEKRITNSKDLRKLRQILPDPVAKDHFLSEEGDLESAMLRLGVPSKKEKGGFTSDLEAVVESMKRVPWTALAEIKKDPDILKKIDEASDLLTALRRTLST
jgi:ParB family chromosome partitioning protein